MKKSEAGAAEILDKLKEICDEKGITIINDISVKDGDIYLNIEHKKIIVGSCVNGKSFNTFMALIA